MKLITNKGLWIARLCIGMSTCIPLGLVIEFFGPLPTLPYILCLTGSLVMSAAMVWIFEDQIKDDLDVPKLTMCPKCGTVHLNGMPPEEHKEVNGTKPILTLIACLIVCTVHAQSRAPDTTRREHKWIVTSLCAASVVSSALGDGLNSRTKYKSGHLLSALSYATVLAIPFVSNKPSWRYPATYLLLRYALFDALYNVGAHRNLNYIGGKNYYDESVGRMPGSVLDATKVLSLGVVIVLNTHK